MGYLSAAYVVCRERGIGFSELFGENARHYYVHGKDNIPFHTIILPALLIAHGGGLRLPDDIVSSEYMTLEGRKISTSHNWAIWVKDIAGKYDPDAIRYFFVSDGPEKRDSDFSWIRFAEKNNGELVGIYGNFINRTLKFIERYQDGFVPSGHPNKEIVRRISEAYRQTGDQIENGRFREALNTAIEFARFGNKYFDGGEPWKTRASNAET